MARANAASSRIPFADVPWRMLARIGLRNLLRHRRRNGLLLISVVTAVASVTFLNALMRGVQVDMFNSARENLNGDWLIVAAGYHDDPGLQQGFVPDPAALAALRQREGTAFVQRLRTPAVILSERETRGVELVGIDPAEETFSVISRVQLEGAFPDGPQPRGIVLGQALADELQTRIGKRVVLVFRDGSGVSHEAGFPVTGLFNADGTLLEKRFAFVGRQSMAVAVPEGAATEISIVVSGDDSPLDARALEQVFPGRDVRSWRQLEPQTAALFDMLDSIMYVWFGIIMAALGFGLVNALVTAIMERRREFGVMRCLGMNRISVLVQVCMESGMLMLAGVLLGTLFGSVLVSMTGGSIDLGRFARGLDIVGFSSQMSLVIEHRDLLNVGLLSLLFGGLASLIPALRANRVPALKAVTGS